MAEECEEKPVPQEKPTPPEQGRCRKIAVEVNEWLAKHARRQNLMRPCEGEPKEFKCEPLRIPDLVPWTSVSWGDSRCDCIEGDDTEIMYVTVCNPYSNLTLSGLTIEKIEVVNANGTAVPLLPDGNPCIQLVPIGPYCFDDIPPCACVTRQFLVRLRAAPGGKYKMMLRGICFEACVHADTEGCFIFEVCPD